MILSLLSRLLSITSSRYFASFKISYILKPVYKESIKVSIKLKKASLAFYFSSICIKGESCALKKQKRRKRETK